MITAATLFKPGDLVVSTYPFTKGMIALILCPGEEAARKNLFSEKYRNFNSCDYNSSDSDIETYGYIWAVIFPAMMDKGIMPYSEHYLS